MNGFPRIIPITCYFVLVDDRFNFQLSLFSSDKTRSVPADRDLSRPLPAAPRAGEPDDRLSGQRQGGAAERQA